jgi:hypothetical protein
MSITENIDVKKSGSGYDIRLKTQQMQAHGLGDLKINYLRVGRQFGLKDLKLNLTISTDIKLDGRYELEVNKTENPSSRSLHPRATL